MPGSFGYSYKLIYPDRSHWFFLIIRITDWNKADAEVVFNTAQETEN